MGPEQLWVSGYVVDKVFIIFFHSACAEQRLPSKLGEDKGEAVKSGNWGHTGTAGTFLNPQMEETPLSHRWWVRRGRRGQFI